MLAPAPAEPLGVEELLELDGEELEEPPLALSFFCTSTEVDEELEPEGVLEEGELVVPDAELEDGEELGALVVPEPDMELDEEPGVVAPEPDGEVVDEDEAPVGVRAVSDLLQPAISAPPNARETAIARVESFIRPPWLGYSIEAARIGPSLLRSHRAAEGSLTSSSAWHPGFSARRCRRYAGSRAAGLPTSDRPGPAAGSTPRASPRW